VKNVKKKKIADFLSFYFIQQLHNTFYAWFVECPKLHLIAFPINENKCSTGSQDINLTLRIRHELCSPSKHMGCYQILGSKKLTVYNL
jgi:hypothetical protein